MQDLNRYRKEIAARLKSAVEPGGPPPRPPKRSNLPRQHTSRLPRLIPGHVPLVETTRGGTTECVHYGSIAVVDTNGKLVASAGDPDSLNFTRSALKPLQALPFVEDGGLAHYGFGSHELALMCASHSGEAMHVSIVQRILARVGSG